MKNKFGDVTIVSAAQMTVHKTIKLASSPFDLLVIRLNPHSSYSFPGMRFESYRGDAVIIPRGSKYTSTPIGGANEYISVRFLSEKPCELEVMHVDDIGEARAVHSELCRSLVFADDKRRMLSLSLFYRLLSMLSDGAAANNYLSSHKLSLIRPALDHIADNIFSLDLKIGDLHKLVGVSSVYFREIFTAYTGMTPHSYITQKRLDRAKEMLEDTGVGMIKDVAAAVGYTDALYFSRIFKKRFGCSPSAFAERCDAEER